MLRCVTGGTCQADTAKLWTDVEATGHRGVDRIRFLFLLVYAVSQPVCLQMGVQARPVKTGPSVLVS